MITLPVSPDYRANERRYGCPSGSTPCVICGRPIKDASRPKMLRTHHDAPVPGVAVVTEAEGSALDESGEGAYWPIGNDCLRQHPELKPYVNGGQP